MNQTTITAKDQQQHCQQLHIEGSADPPGSPTGAVPAALDVLRQFRDLRPGAAVCKHDGALLWIPNLRVRLGQDVPGGNTGYTLVGTPANEVSAMTSAKTTGSKPLAVGDPRYCLIVDQIAWTSRSCRMRSVTYDAENSLRMLP